MKINADLHIPVDVVLKAAQRAGLKDVVVLGHVGDKFEVWSSDSMEQTLHTVMKFLAEYKEV